MSRLAVVSSGHHRLTPLCDRGHVSQLAVASSGKHRLTTKLSDRRGGGGGASESVGCSFFRAAQTTQLRDLWQGSPGLCCCMLDAERPSYSLVYL